jgi:excisionase family DNA binding protein
VEKLLTYHEVAILLHLSVRYIAKLVSLGQIPFIKIGRSVRFNPTQIDQWIERRSNVV